MRFGLSESEILQIQMILALFPEVEEAILYGSRAKGEFQPSSDIDLTLIGENISLSAFFDIENQLDDLLLPYKIDLSVFHKISNQDLIDHIHRVGVTFYQREAHLKG